MSRYSWANVIPPEVKQAVVKAIKDGWTRRRTAREFKIGQWSVWYVLKKFDPKAPSRRRRKLTAPVVQAIGKMREAGYKLLDIAAHFKIARSGICRALKAYRDEQELRRGVESMRDNLDRYFPRLAAS